MIACLTIRVCDDWASFCKCKQGLWKQPNSNPCTLAVNNFLIKAPAVSPMLSRRTCNMETLLSPDKNTRIKVELGDLAASPSCCHRARILWHDPSVVFLMSISKEISPIWMKVRSWWHCLLCYTSLISTGNTRSSKWIWKSVLSFPLLRKVKQYPERTLPAWSTAAFYWEDILLEAH